MRARRWLPLSSTVALALFLSAQAAAERFEKETAAPEEGAFVIAVDQGDVEVVRTEESDSDRIRVRAEARGFGASDVAFDLERGDRNLTLRGRQAEWLRYVADGPRVRVRAWVPRTVPVRIERVRDASSPVVRPASAYQPAAATGTPLPVVQPAVNR